MVLKKEGISEGRREEGVSEACETGGRKQEESIWRIRRGALQMSHPRNEVHDVLIFFVSHIGGGIVFPEFIHAMNQLVIDR